MVIEMASLAQHGAAPWGDYMDAPRVLIEAVRYVWAEQERWKARLIERAANG